MRDRIKWVLLAYRIPREPSTPRIAVWRKLRQLGAVNIVDGLVALPSNNSTREQLQWLGEQVREADGEAWVWDAVLSSAARERTLITAMSREVAGDYRALAKSARRARDEDAPARGRAVARLRREFRRVAARDYFGAPEKRAATEALDRAAAAHGSVRA